uniref:Uncharacterized protein n=1 Tax=Timema genevievae TaxID=629358 RepID=A0A7R9PHH6_TIMGE|nr:unnamed protein product [Timema genevievae]
MTLSTANYFVSHVVVASSREFPRQSNPRTTMQDPAQGLPASATKNDAPISSLITQQWNLNIVVVFLLTKHLHATVVSQHRKKVDISKLAPWTPGRIPDCWLLLLAISSLSDTLRSYVDATLNACAAISLVTFLCRRDSKWLCYYFSAHLNARPTPRLTPSYSLNQTSYSDGIKVDSKVGFADSSQSNGNHHRPTFHGPTGDAVSPGIISAVLKVQVVPTSKVKGSVCTAGSRCAPKSTEMYDYDDEDENIRKDDITNGNKTNRTVKIITGLDDPVNEDESNQYSNVNHDGNKKLVKNTEKQKKVIKVPHIPIHRGNYVGVDTADDPFNSPSFPNWEPEIVHGHEYLPFHDVLLSRNERNPEFSSQLPLYYSRNVITPVSREGPDSRDYIGSKTHEGFFAEDYQPRGSEEKFHSRVIGEELQPRVPVAYQGMIPRPYVRSYPGYRNIIQKRNSFRTYQTGVHQEPPRNRISNEYAPVAFGYGGNSDAPHQYIQNQMTEVDDKIDIDLGTMISLVNQPDTSYAAEKGGTSEISVNGKLAFYDKGKRTAFKLMSTAAHYNESLKAFGEECMADIIERDNQLPHVSIFRESLCKGRGVCLDRQAWILQNNLRESSETYSQSCLHL